ncbi:hypothetical protein PCANC_08224 [Puccinia coronata f. sp. avenae]|uniref:Uncharacterized protein n=1 Tax=Puccinia coronata f. sp. avenae TaxID=200324 RepID=A0A2N5SVD2_9BASI|nr:hypothetical protein PCASD_18143 [Puccinia coronata f. sp. avenae]PLW20823.1 hypothetical protein PCANC_08224 [Puccinia coronata f. sp. avenae]PLW42180.1 hypothetical protein PCASD_05632 [Puccinia coronata f. sp. avenae]
MLGCATSGARLTSRNLDCDREQMASSKLETQALPAYRTVGHRYVQAFVALFGSTSADTGLNDTSL